SGRSHLAQPGPGAGPTLAAGGIWIACRGGGGMRLSSNRDIGKSTPDAAGRCRPLHRSESAGRDRNRDRRSSGLRDRKSADAQRRIAGGGWAGLEARGGTIADHPNASGRDVTRPLRFLHVSTFFPPYSFGGDAVYLWRLANALAEDGHLVDIVHC